MGVHKAALIPGRPDLVPFGSTLTPDVTGSLARRTSSAVVGPWSMRSPQLSATSPPHPQAGRSRSRHRGRRRTPDELCPCLRRPRCPARSPSSKGDAGWPPPLPGGPRNADLQRCRSAPGRWGARRAGANRPVEVTPPRGGGEGWSVSAQGRVGVGSGAGPDAGRGQRRQAPFRWDGTVGLGRAPPDGPGGRIETVVKGGVAMRGKCLRRVACPAARARAGRWGWSGARGVVGMRVDAGSCLGLAGGLWPGPGRGRTVPTVLLSGFSGPVVSGARGSAAMCP
jgi:hypothetical protein